MGHGQTLPVREDVPSLDDLQLFPSLDVLHQTPLEGMFASCTQTARKLSFLSTAIVG